MHGYPVMQVVQYSVPTCTWGPPPPPPDLLRPPSVVPHHPPGVRKYVIWCLICGGILCLIGVMFLAVYFLLRSYTSTVGYFETVPPFVPSTLLLLTGLCVISLARRRNRYSYLIKLSGACSLASALTCALVTVTTTVIHMSRLQALRECQYTQKTRTCTCSSTLSESDDGDDIGSVRFVFDATTDCSVVHGALYSCLRAVFGLSVAGVFVSVFSCMLVYQLLSHERKKMYWEQLELRCRSLYSGGPLPPPPGPAIIGTTTSGPCRCCEQCHAHRAMPTAYTWDTDSRFWAGQAGNFYSPNPGDEATSGGGQRNRWNWPRMPWQRNADSSPQNSQSQASSASNRRYSQHQVSSSDSQYGFSNGGGTNPDASSQQNGYSVIAPYGVHWGPPPPYSDPNSPARRGRYQYIHPSTCHQNIIEQHISQQSPQIHHEHSSSATDTEQPSLQNMPQQRNAIKRVNGGQFKTKENYENAPSDSDGPPRISNTLPIRKTKKHISNVVNKSIGPQSSNNSQQVRANVQNVFNNLQADSKNHSELSENEYNEPTSLHAITELSSSLTPQHQGKDVHVKNIISLNNRRLKLGIENTGFQPIDAAEQTPPNGESEVYFADVSSCCNIYEDANQRRVMIKNDKSDADEYLSHRFGNREPSIRSRMPFPQVDSKMIVPAPRTSIMQKEVSRQSMCSIDSSGEKTDFTDLSPATPTAAAPNCINPASDNFVASFPSYNEQSSQEAHRRSTKNLQDILNSPYESIKDDITPLTLNNYELNHDMSSSSSSSYNKSSPIRNYSNSASTPTKLMGGCKGGSGGEESVNVTPIKRSTLGTNISAIIQNLSGNDISLLYPENNKATVSSPHHHPHNKQKQDCNNDVINSNIVIKSNNNDKEWMSITELNGNDQRM